MRVLMLSWEYPPKVVGGLGRHVTELAGALARCGTEVTVVANVDDGPRREARGALRVVRVGETYPPSPDVCEAVAQGNTALLQGVLQETASGARFDVVHAHDWLTAYAARAAKHALGAPLVATFHATEHGRNGGLKSELQRHIGDVEWWLAYEAWRVICCSRFMEAEVRDLFQLPTDKIRVIPNGVRLSASLPGEEERRALRRRFALDDQPLIAFVGRLVHEKGVDLLVRAFARLAGAYPSAVLAIAGRGPFEGALRALSGELGLDGGVRFLGHISDEERNTLYQSADVVVFPSRYEPFGIVALEAMAHEAPVVAARTGGLAEVISDGRTGVLVRPDDVDALAGAVGELLAQPQRARRMGAAARTEVGARYDWERIARMTLEVYREVGPRL